MCGILQDKPYALFGTCLGAITCYELAQSAERAGLPGPVALFTAAVSPPHLYALAVMKLYVTRTLGAGEPPPLEEVLRSLEGWRDLPREVLMQVCVCPSPLQHATWGCAVLHDRCRQNMSKGGRAGRGSAMHVLLNSGVTVCPDAALPCLRSRSATSLTPALGRQRVQSSVPRPHPTLQVFEKGNFAGLDAMRANQRLFDRVAPMGVADILSAVRYQHRQQPALATPITAFDGLLDATIERGNMEHWAEYTGAAFQLVPVRGDHYFVSTHYRQARCLTAVSREALSADRNAVKLGTKGCRSGALQLHDG